jgi:hypothetical protein
MKALYATTVTVLLLIALTFPGNAQTVTFNNEPWSTLVPSGTCNNCTITIPAGYTLLLNSSGTCNGCTFNGGTVKITAGFTFNNAATNFNNDTVLVNTNTTFWSVNFSNDSVSAIGTISSQNNTSTISHTRMYAAAALTFNAANLNDDSIHINNVTFKMNNTPANFTSSFVEVYGGSGKITTPGSTFTSSNFIFSGSSAMTIDNSFISDGSSFTMHGTSLVKSNGTTDIKNSSSIIMDGTSNSFTAGNALPITNSTVTMSSGSILKGSSLTLTGSTVTAKGGTITSDNALSLTGSTLTGSGTSIKGSSVTIQTGSTMTLNGSSSLKSDNAITITGSNLTADSTIIRGSSFTAQTSSTVNVSGNTTLTSDNAIIFTASNLTTGGSVIMKGSSALIQTGSVVKMGGASNLTVDNAIDFKASTASFSGDAWAKANDKVIIENNSSVVAGDGPVAGTAHLMTNNSLQVLDASQLKIANGNNYIYTSASNFTGGSSSYPIQTNTISCGTGHPHACTSGYVYGCATLNSSGAVGCVVLALSAPQLNARLSGGQVSLSWQTTENNKADRFLVQHSTNGADWTLVTEVMTNALQSGYSTIDPHAQPGNNYYRLQEIDKDGHTAWSAVSIIKMETAAGEMTLYPNPVKGHTFFLKVPATDALILKVYTPGGQLLLLSSLKGQTQYTVQLPATVMTNSYILVQVIGNARTQTFTVLAQ